MDILLRSESLNWRTFALKRVQEPELCVGMAYNQCHIAIQHLIPRWRAVYILNTSQALEEFQSARIVLGTCDNFGLPLVPHYFILRSQVFEICGLTRKFFDNGLRIGHKISGSWELSASSAAASSSLYDPCVLELVVSEHYSTVSAFEALYVARRMRKDKLVSR